MTTRVLIPIKAPELCKTRLRNALSDEARSTLVESMLAHVIETAQRARGVDDIFLLAPVHRAHCSQLPTIADPGGGLNAALTHAMQTTPSNITRVVVIAADLPLITPPDIEALVNIGGGALGIAPDRAGRGTNALSLPLPAARAFRFQFGAESFALHAGESARLNLMLSVQRAQSLGFDVDEPEDIANARAALNANKKASSP